MQQKGLQTRPGCVPSYIKAPFWKAAPTPTLMRWESQSIDALLDRLAKAEWDRIWFMRFCCGDCFLEQNSVWETRGKVKFSRNEGSAGFSYSISSEMIILCAVLEKDTGLWRTFPQRQLGLKSALSQQCVVYKEGIAGTKDLSFWVHQAMCE